jgi:Na+/H+ antiporter NhaC
MHNDRYAIQRRVGDFQLVSSVQGFFFQVVFMCIYMCVCNDGERIYEIEEIEHIIWGWMKGMMEYIEIYLYCVY